MAADLSGRVALVAGATRGAGLAIAVEQRLRGRPGQRRLDVALRRRHRRGLGGRDRWCRPVNADGLVRRGNRLTVVRNFSRMIATLRLSADGSRAELLDQAAAAAHRVLTTAKALRGRILYVDSKLDEPVTSGPYEIMTDPTR